MTRAVAVRPLGGGQQPAQAGRLRLVEDAGLVGLMPGEQQPGERDVLVLAQVRQLVIGGQPALAGPLLGVPRARRGEAGAGRAQREPAARWGSSRRCRPGPPRRAARARRRGRLRLPAAGPRRPAERYGFCGSPLCSPSRSLTASCSAAPARSSRSSSTPAMPTCMSAVPRSGVAPGGAGARARAHG